MREKETGMRTLDARTDWDTRDWSEAQDNVGHWHRGTADDCVTIDQWRDIQRERAAALKALRALTRERDARAAAERERLRAFPMTPLELLLAGLHGPVQGCLDCEWYGERCDEHTQRRELEPDTGIVDRKEGTATGALSDDRPCLHCGTSFKASARRGRPAVTCSARCRELRRKDRDRHRKAGTTPPVSEVVRRAQALAEDVYARPLPVREVRGSGISLGEGFMPFDWNTGGNPDEGATVVGLKVLGAPA